MKKINTVVVGQGIAGSLVAFMLHLQNVPFIVIDPGLSNTSSRVAAGMFTPISGKRKTIQSLVPQQISLAVKMYRQLEQLLDISFLHFDHIHQVYNSTEERTELTAKLNNSSFAEYIFNSPRSLPGIRQPFGAFEISHSGWVDCELMINQFCQWLKRNDILSGTFFLHKDIRFLNNSMEYHGIEFKNIIFCEGYQTTPNPFFPHENIIPCKGDILTIKYDHLPGGHIIKKNTTYLIAAGDDIFRAGSTYHWNNNTMQPDEADKKTIEAQLDLMLDNKYTTIDHRSGIRPTTKNREVIARQHPQHTGMFLLNGLGTRGILQGPWWSKYIVELLLR